MSRTSRQHLNGRSSSLITPRHGPARDLLLVELAKVIVEGRQHDHLPRTRVFDYKSAMGTAESKDLDTHCSDLKFWIHAPRDMITEVGLLGANTSPEVPWCGDHLVRRSIQAAIYNLAFQSFDDSLYVIDVAIPGVHDVPNKLDS